MKSLTKGLIASAAVGAMVLGASGPASAASAGAGTGWEYQETAGSGGCGLPQSGFYFKSTHFKLRLQAATGATDLAFDIGPSIAAPHGAAPAPSGCGNPLVPVVPGAVDITGGSGACTGASGTYTRVNTSVAFDFTCGGTRYVIAGQQDVCGVPTVFAPPPADVVPNPECGLDPLYPDPGYGGDSASSHLVVTFVATP